MDASFETKSTGCTDASQVDGSLRPERDIPHGVRPQIGEEFRIRDDGSANWVVRRIVEARAYARHVEAWAACEIRRAEADERSLINRFSGQLDEWLRRELADRKCRRKSIALPAGTVGLRKAPDRLDVIDPPQVAAWALLNLPEAIRITVNAAGNDAIALQRWAREQAPTASVAERLSKSALSEHVQRTGELPVGVTHVVGVEQLTIK